MVYFLLLKRKITLKTDITGRLPRHTLCVASGYENNIRAYDGHSNT